MWKIKDISESDYGCEERMPGEPLMAFVTIESDAGEEETFEVMDNWLITQKLDVGDEWPEDTNADETAEERVMKQADFMNNYLDALDELDD